MNNYYTTTDYAHASKFAVYKIREDLCLNPDIKKQLPGTDWVPNKFLQDFSCPLGLPRCDEAAGSCKFLTKDSCLAQSGDFKNQGQGEKPYLEWHPELEGAKTATGEKIGKCILGNFALRDWCENPHSRRAGQFVAGVTNTPPFHYNQTTGNCEMTKDYCDYMGIGFTDRNDDYYKETGIDVPDCHESTVQKIAEKITGKVLFRGFKRGLFTKFLKDFSKSLLEPGPLTFYDFVKKTADGEFADDLGMNKDYSGIEDYKSKEGMAGERMAHFKEGFMKSMEKEIKNMKVPAPSGAGPFQNLTAVCDPRAISEKKLLAPDFGGPGVNLYFITWNEGYLDKNPGTKPFQFGFLCDELEKAGLPIVKKDGYRAVRLTKENTKDDRFFRRIYLVYAYPDWTFSFLGNTMVDTNLLNYILQKLGPKEN